MNEIRLIRPPCAENNEKNKKTGNEKGREEKTHYYEKNYKKVIKKRENAKKCKQNAEMRLSPHAFFMGTEIQDPPRR